jgi:hypothetical protein
VAYLVWHVRTKNRPIGTVRAINVK